MTNLTNDSLFDLLGDVPAFSGIERALLEKIVAQTSRESMGRGHVLIEEGAPADKLYIVLRGRFDVLAGETKIAEISVGEPIGEIAFFAGGERTANVVSARNSEVLVLSRVAYDGLAREVPELAGSILASIAKRLASATGANLKLHPRAGSVTGFVPAGSEPIPAEFVERLRGSSGEFGIATVADIPATLDTVAKISVWLSELEQSQQRIILLCENPTATPLWAEAVCAQADNVYLVGGHEAAKSGPVSYSQLEINIFAQTHASNIHLVIWRAQSDTKITDTANWLARRPVALHHHVALDTAADFSRLIRFVDGAAIGLVLCGGGAFGTGHLGLIKALREHGYVFDYIGGTSVGAAMGAALAMGLSPDETMVYCESIFIKSKAMNRYTLPVHSVVDHAGFDAQMSKHYGEFQTEDTPLGFFAVATSLTRNDIQVLRQGELWHTVRASSSIPAVFPPFITDDGDVLIDGSFVDNVPITVMRELKSGPNIVLNLKPGKPWQVRSSYGEMPGRLQTFLRLFRKPSTNKAQFPTIPAVLSRTMVVSSQRLMDSLVQEDDVMLEISPLPGMGFLDWGKGQRQFDAAYVAMVAALEDVEANSPGRGTDGLDELRQISSTFSNREFGARRVR